MAGKPKMVNTSVSLFEDQVECLNKELIIRRENSIARLVREAVTNHLIRLGYVQNEEGYFTGEKED